MNSTYGNQYEELEHFKIHYEQKVKENKIIKEEFE